MHIHEIFAVTLLASLCASASVPVISNVTSSQNESRRVTVSYTLSEEPGIVTLTAQTNRGDNIWVDVDDANLTYVVGDANKLVMPGDHTLTWLPHKSWPNQLITGGNIRIGVKAWATNAPPDYMVVNLVVPGEVRYYASAGSVPFGVTNETYKSDCLVMRKVPAANVEFRMGEAAHETGGGDGNSEPHVAKLTYDYYLGVYPLTQRQCTMICGYHCSQFINSSDSAFRPVDWATYNTCRGSDFTLADNGRVVGATSIIGQLRTLCGMQGFDLPTEAQWEYACRAGCGAALYNGKELENVSQSANLSEIGWHKASETSVVGLRAPNAWGFYDMLGNIYEWCNDQWVGGMAYKTCDPEIGPTGGWGAFALRGGMFSSEAKHCRCASRSVANRNDAGWYGLRLFHPAVVSR